MHRVPSAAIRNANRALAVMALLMVVLFLGSNGLIQHFAGAAGEQEDHPVGADGQILGSEHLRA